MNEEKIEAAAQEMVSTISDGDMEEVNQLIFHTNELTVDKELRSSEDKNQGQGILQVIFEQVQIRLMDVTKTSIQYEIKVPNMQHALQNLETSQENITEEELKDYLEAYAKNAKPVTTKVKVPYEMKDENVYIHYQTEDFINALTGGLLRSYQQLYQESLSEYQKEVQK